MKPSQGAEPMEMVIPGFPTSCWEWKGWWCCSGCVCGLTCSCLQSNAMGQGDDTGAGRVLLACIPYPQVVVVGSWPCVQGEKRTLGPCWSHLVPVGRCRPSLESSTQPLPCAQLGGVTQVSKNSLRPCPTIGLCPCVTILVLHGHILAPPSMCHLGTASPPLLFQSQHHHPQRLHPQSPHPCPSSASCSHHPQPSPPALSHVPTTLLTPPFAAAFGQRSPSPSAVPQCIHASKAEEWPSCSRPGLCVFTFTLCFEYFPPRSM